MAVVEQLLRAETNGSISFGNHKLEQKAKLEDFEYGGDVYKVKTYQAMTKLEKNGLFLYESVPGTSVLNFSEGDKELSFTVEGNQDAQITIGLEVESEYEVFIGKSSVGTMKTNLAGKLNVSVELEGVGEIDVKLIKC